jgi:DNA-binding NarL/FixJ family response regulator
VRLLLLEDQAPTRAGIRLALSGDGFEIVGEAAVLDEALDVLRESEVDICLVGGELNGSATSTIRALRDGAPTSKIILLSSAHPADPSCGVLAAFDAGASGWLRKDVSPKRLPVLLRALRNGERIVPRSLVSALIDEVVDRRRRGPATRLFPNGAALTMRESEVLALLSEGATTARTAQQLGISHVTVRRHLSDAVKKLGVADRAAAARLFRSVQSEWATRPIDGQGPGGQPQSTNGRG